MENPAITSHGNSQPLLFSEWVEEKGKISKTVNFSEWFREFGSDSMFSGAEAVGRRFVLSHPASEIYTINSGDKLAKKAAKVALRILFCLTVIPIVLVKVIDFFAGEEHTRESDIKNQFRQLEGSMRAISHECKNENLKDISDPDGSDPELMILKTLITFKGDQEKIFQFLNVLSEKLGYRLLEELNKTGRNQEILEQFLPDKKGNLEWVSLEGDGHKSLDRRQSVDFEKQQIKTLLKVRAQVMPKNKPDAPFKGIFFKQRDAEIFFDFKEKQVTITLDLQKSDQTR